MRGGGSSEVVTVIELLSIANKEGSVRREYLAKRERILASSVHLVEIDLLRGGDRVPMEEAFPPDPYFVLVHRADQRPLADVWPICLEQQLPTIPIPLADQDPDTNVDLQEAFNYAFV